MATTEPVRELQKTERGEACDASRSSFFFPHASTSRSALNTFNGPVTVVALGFYRSNLQPYISVTAARAGW